MAPAIVELLRRQGEAGNHPMVQRIIAGDHLLQFDLAVSDAYRQGQIVAAGKAALAAGVRTVIWVAMGRNQPSRISWAMPRASLRSVLTGIALNAFRTCRVSSNSTANPASRIAAYSHCDSGPASAQSSSSPALGRGTTRSGSRAR